MRKNAPNSVPSEVGGLRCAASKPQCSEWNCRSLRRRPAISGRLLPTGSRWFWRLLQQKPKPLKQREVVKSHGVVREAYALTF